MKHDDTIRGTGLPDSDDGKIEDTPILSTSLKGDCWKIIAVCSCLLVVLAIAILTLSQYSTVYIIH